MKEKNVIIIGATGFIGVYTVEYFLLSGFKVYALGRNKLIGDYLTSIGAKFIQFDLNNEDDYKELPTKNINGVVLLAGLLPANSKTNLDVDENVEEYFKINVLGAIKVLEFCRRNSIKKIIGCCSYSDVSRAWREGYAITEKEPRNFYYYGDHASYIISKNAINDIMEYYNQQHKMKCSWFRLPPVYGVGPHGTIYVNGQIYKSGIATFIDNIKNGKDVEIWGNPHIKRDIVYVKDVAKAFVQIIESDNAHGLYNISSGVELELEEQVKVLMEVFRNDKGSQIVYRPEKNNNSPSFLFSIKKAQKDFGYSPVFSDFLTMMEDYKKELQSRKWDFLFKTRCKE